MDVKLLSSNPVSRLNLANLAQSSAMSNHSAVENNYAEGKEKYNVWLCAASACSGILYSLLFLPCTIHVATPTGSAECTEALEHLKDSFG